MKSALVRNKETKNLKVIRSNDYTSNKSFSDELRVNGYRVLKVWNRHITDEEADEWEYLNRK